MNLERVHPMDAQTLYHRAQALTPELSAWRRHLHRLPELGGLEWETGTYLLQTLEAMGVEASRAPGQTAVVGRIRGEGNGGVVALRADMDALPIQEVPGRAYGSAVPGVMHACGHDAHMAIQLGAAALLAACRADWRGEVRLLFEPAEETDGGAQALIDAGHMDGVQAVFGLHMQPSLSAGQLQTRPGAMSGCIDSLSLTILGQSCHGAYPEKGIDAVVLAAQVICALQTVVSRRTSPLDSAVISIGRIEGGTAANILAERVTLTGTLRTLRPETRTKVIEQIQTLSGGLCAAMGGRCEWTITPGYHAVLCDPHWVERLGAFARDAGIEALTKETPSLGADSFGDLTVCAPGLYYDLGCGMGPDAPPIHTENFDVDERCLPLGAYLQAMLALDALKAGAKK